VSPHAAHRTEDDLPGVCNKEHEWGVLQQHMATTEKTLADILAQCRSTNGRVGSLEKWRTVLMTATGTLLMTDTEGIVRVIKTIAAALRGAGP